MSVEEHRRAQLVQIWEDLSQSAKNRFSSAIGFSGKPESRRRSVRRLVQGSRSISPSKQEFIRRSYAARYGEDKVVDVEDYEKLDVTSYFKPYTIGKTRAWNGQSPPIAFQTTYRIRAIVMAVQYDSNLNAWVAQEHTIWTSGVGSTFSQLARMLQDEIDRMFDEPQGGYRTYGIAFSDSGKSPLISRANKSGEVGDVVAPTSGALSVVIYSSTTRPSEAGETFRTVGYDD